MNTFSESMFEHPPIDPRRQLVEGFTAFELIFQKSYLEINGLVAATSADSILNANESNPATDQILLEAALNKEFPQIPEATSLMKRSLDKLEGRSISWHHSYPGEPKVDHREDEHGNSLILIRRDERQFEPMSGFIVGSQIGPDPVMGGIGAWIEVAEEEDWARGINHSMGQMVDIFIGDE